MNRDAKRPREKKSRDDVLMESAVWKMKMDVSWKFFNHYECGIICNMRAHAKKFRNIPLHGNLKLNLKKYHKHTLS